MFRLVRYEPALDVEPDVCGALLYALPLDTEGASLSDHGGRVFTPIPGTPLPTPSRCSCKTMVRTARTKLRSEVRYPYCAAHIEGWLRAHPLDGARHGLHPHAIANAIGCNHLRIVGYYEITPGRTFQVWMNDDVAEAMLDQLESDGRLSGDLAMALRLRALELTDDRDAFRLPSTDDDCLIEDVAACIGAVVRDPSALVQIAGDFAERWLPGLCGRTDATVAREMFERAVRVVAGPWSASEASRAIWSRWESIPPF